VQFIAWVRYTYVTIFLARKASAGRLMLCRCYFLSYFFFLASSFFNDRLEQRDLGNYKPDLHQIFRDGRHVGVHIHSGTGFPIGQETLPWQPILGAKSTEIGDTPSFLGGTRIPQRIWQYGKADGHIISADVLSTFKILANGPLTPEFTVIVLRPFMRKWAKSAKRV